MSYLFLTILFLAIIHFVYESIWAPTFRLQLRRQLFDLSEELKELKKTHHGKENDKVFRYMQDAINNLSNTINGFEIVAVAQAIAKVEQDKNLKERLEERVKALDGCGVPEIKALWQKIAKRAIKAIKVNSGGWFVYLVTIALFALCLQKMYQIAKALVSLPGSYLEGFSSDNGPTSLAA